MSSSNDDLFDFKDKVSEAKKALLKADEFLSKLRRLENTVEYKELFLKNTNLEYYFKNAKSVVEMALKKISR